MTQPVPILLYHGVADAAPGPLRDFTVTPPKFESQLEQIAAMGCRTLTVSEYVGRHIVGGQPVAPNTVLLTFDDGFADFATTALPVLERFELAATLYVTTGGIGGTCSWLGDSCSSLRMLDVESLRGIDGTLVEIGAHSVTHPELDVLGPVPMAQEVEGSKDHLESLLDRPVRTFAYPHGYHSPAVRQAVLRAGYHSACAVKNALSHVGDDCFALARVTVGPNLGQAELERVIRGERRAVVSSREALRTRGWRLVRRVKHHRRRLTV